jgi:hypothetical protein
VSPVYTVKDLVERWEAALEKVLVEHEARISSLEKKSRRLADMRSVVVAGVTALVASVSALFFGCAPPPPREMPSPPSVLDPMRASTVSVLDAEDFEFIGTGWYLAPDLVVSAGHVCEEELHMVENLNGSRHFALVLHSDGGLATDLCILAVPGASGIPLLLADGTPSPGTPVRFFGYPAGYPGYGAGPITGHESGLTVIAMTAWFGTSGSAVVDDRGRVVGVLVRIVPGSGLAFAVPVETLREALEALP